MFVYKYNSKYDASHNCGNGYNAWYSLEELKNILLWHINR